MAETRRRTAKPTLEARMLASLEAQKATGVILAVSVLGVLLWALRDIVTPLVLAVFLLLMIDGLARALSTRVPRFPDKLGLPQLKQQIQVGASPRATLALAKAARANAFVQHRGFVTPEDVKSVAYDVLRHRVLVSFEAEADGVGSEQVVRRILEHVEVP